GGFRGVGKLPENYPKQTSNFCDLDDFTYAHTPKHACGKYRPQKRPFSASKMAQKFEKMKVFAITARN
ncbi:hypothetical protein RGC28_08335, partial [Helicobacter pylori]|uniref:hypothetical protein n=1 Tax=Helicobacter pylori TaxID=210 RepID=UPI0029280C72